MTAEIAVIGAGPAGLAAASALQRAGRSVMVLEKSRGIGGRLATRRTRTGLDFDHGAPSVPGRPLPFAAFLDGAISAGHGATWRGAVVGLPGMSGLLAGLAAPLDIRFGTEATEITRGAAGWRVAMGEESLTVAGVVCTAPAPQTARLCASIPEIAEAAHAARMTPCWALMVAWEDAGSVPATLPEPLSVVTDTASKPERAAGPHRFTAHAETGWSEAHLEADRETVEAALLPVLAGAVGAAGAPLYAAAHRWRFARVAQPVGLDCVVAPGGLVAAGDWVSGAEAGDAYASGLAAAAALAG
jgi:predicted NAD/FAD-dependent oxidoreductase